MGQSFNGEWGQGNTTLPFPLFLPPLNKQNNPHPIEKRHLGFYIQQPTYEWGGNVEKCNFRNFFEKALWFAQIWRAISPIILTHQDFLTLLMNVYYGFWCCVFFVRTFRFFASLYLCISLYLNTQSGVDKVLESILLHYCSTLNHFSILFPSYFSHRNRFQCYFNKNVLPTIISVLFFYHLTVSFSGNLHNKQFPKKQIDIL